MIKKSKKKFGWIVLNIIAFIILCSLIGLIIYFTTKKYPSPKPSPKPSPNPSPTPSPTPSPGPSPDIVHDKIKSYLNAVYPTSTKVKAMTSAEAETFYKSQWFYFLVLDYLGVPSTTNNNKGNTITIPGTLSNIPYLMPVRI